MARNYSYSASETTKNAGRPLAGEPRFAAASEPVASKPAARPKGSCARARKDGMESRRKGKVRVASGLPQACQQAACLPEARLPTGGSRFYFLSRPGETAAA